MGQHGSFLGRGVLHTWRFLGIRVLQKIINLNRIFHYKPTILGYPHLFMEPPMLLTANWLSDFSRRIFDFFHQQLTVLLTSNRRLTCTKSGFENQCYWSSWMIHAHETHSFYDQNQNLLVQLVINVDWLFVASTEIVNS